MCFCQIPSVCVSEAVLSFQKSRNSERDFNRDYPKSNPERIALFETPESREEVKKKRGGSRVVFEVMAKLAGDLEATPSMMEDVEVDDDTPNRHEFRLGVRTELMTTPNLRRMTLGVESK